MELRRFVEVLDGPQPLVDQAHAVVGPALQRVGDHRRQDDLATVAGGGDTRGVVHVDADVVLGVARAAAVAKPAFALVEAHPDPQRHLGRPGLGGERALGGDDGVRGIVRSLEGREERVTLGLDDDARVAPRSPRAAAGRGARRCRPTQPIPPTARAVSSPRCR